MTMYIISIDLIQVNQRRLREGKIEQYLNVDKSFTRAREGDLVI